ncbi:MAG: hypothetical protein AABX70_01605 [Nanoarchaeota archaeon]
MLSADELDTNVFRRILRNNLNVQNEKVLIIGDEGHKGSPIAKILAQKYQEAVEELGIKYEVFYKSITPYGSVDNELAKVIKRLPDQSIILVNVSQKMGRMDELLSFRSYCKQHQHRFASSSNLSTLTKEHLPHLLKVYAANYKEMAVRSEKVTALLNGAQEILITTPSGTNLKLNVSGMKSIINSGIYRNPGEGGNLPAGEVYLPPTLLGVEGTIVIDGSYRTREGSKLIQDPITLSIQESNVNSIEGGIEATDLRETLAWAKLQSKNPHMIKIGELGIGINEEAGIIGCTVVDEKTLGTCHFAIGSNSWFGGPIKARIHLDQVIRNPKIFVDGKRLSV